MTALLPKHDSPQPGDNIVDVAPRAGHRTFGLDAALPMVRVGGVNVATLTRAEWVDVIVGRALGRRRGIGTPAFFTAANGHVLSHYARDPNFRILMDAADGTEADGMPLVFASRWLTRTPIPERCDTTPIYWSIAKRLSDAGGSMFLLGATDETNRAAIAATRNRFPDLKIEGRHGYFADEAEERLAVARINAAAPSVLWVGMGVPLEHAFVVRHREAMTDVGVVKTCGGMFSFVAGRAARAPVWMQNIGLEWVYRTLREPRRLLWRYVTTNTHALWLLAARTSTAKRSAPSMRR
jgi:N-acetylglucosaminyldiphosphoundecaprenol N-acetyl-beta-D-mannosaminyltransferase